MAVADTGVAAEVIGRIFCGRIHNVIELKGLAWNQQRRATIDVLKGF